ncbi:hypothetical protein M9458_050804 [Cirrhinus mrigala]|uniref:Transposase n=1 Tax=Cirrhinus mrigala TaxID=683832 RepID=A0ABD0MXC2_CIRMR
MNVTSAKQKKGPQKLSDHSYPAVSNTTRGSSQELDVRGLCTSFPTTPSNSPASKKSKADLSLHELQENIITALNNRADSLEEMIIANSNTIEELKSSLLFVNAEIADLQKSKVELTAKVTEQTKAISQLENRVIEAERYKRRWCLRLYGAPEVENENVKVKVMEICKGVAPEIMAKMSEAVDVAHRLGRPVAGRARAIINLFALRWVRDVIWKSAKNSDYLKERKLRFGEDLTKEEKASRALLWPYVQKARNEGKKSYFIGSKAYVDGREIVPEKMDTT